MLLTGTEDLRVQKTITAIDAAFSSLLLEGDYHDISIRLLCERARINKKTFYRYYPTLHDLFREKLERLSQGYLDRIAGYSLPENLAAINREFFLYACEQGELYERLICHPSYAIHGREMLGSLVRRAWKHSPQFGRLDADRQALVITFLQTAGMELYRRWVLDGKALPLEEILRTSELLLCHGIQGFFGECERH